MKVSAFLEHVNSALNYPALEINDIRVYIDQAMAELNTTLHISLPTFTEQLDVFLQNTSKVDLVLLTEDPEGQGKEIPIYTIGSVKPDNVPAYYDQIERQFYIKQGKNYIQSNRFLGKYIVHGVTTTWGPLVVGGQAFWVASDNEDNVDDFEMSEYLPNDWVLLFLIPYVCFKYTARDGGTSSTFAEELSQGFQQLQETYNIPSKVLLATMAGKTAYTELIKEKLPNLNILVPVCAIYDEMKHAREVLPEYGSMYDRGGF